MRKKKSRPKNERLLQTCKPFQSEFEDCTVNYPAVVPDGRGSSGGSFEETPDLLNGNHHRYRRPGGTGERLPGRRARIAPGMAVVGSRRGNRA